MCNEFFEIKSAFEVIINDLEIIYYIHGKQLKIN